jgi:uncharacterized protein (TIGR04255 family)
MTHPLSGGLRTGRSQGTHSRGRPAGRTRKSTRRALPTRIRAALDGDAVVRKMAPGVGGEREALLSAHLPHISRALRRVPATQTSASRVTVDHRGRPGDASPCRRMWLPRVIRGATVPKVGVDYCTKSTIAEAWATVLGLPAPLDETDAAAVTRVARERIEGLQRKPSLVVVNARADLASPFWREQFAWNRDRYLARFGHRYLSVHFVRQGEERYNTFDSSLRPSVQEWLDIFSVAAGKAAKEQFVDRVAFGYVNSFRFPLHGFDLSRWFRVNFAVDIGSPSAALAAFTISSVFVSPDTGVQTNLEISVETPNDGTSDLSIITKVSADSSIGDSVSFANTGALLVGITRAKEAAKHTFFGLATDETHNLMGVVQDAADKSH